MKTEHTHSDLLNKEATESNRLFCCEKHSVNNVENCLWLQLLHFLAEKGHRFSFDWTDVKKIVSQCVCNISVLIYGLRRKNGCHNSSCTQHAAHHSQCHVMAPCELTFAFCRPEPVILRVDMSTKIKPSFITNRKILGSIS